MSRTHSTEEMIDPANLFSIRGKVALVTGGSRGIGLMIARGFVEAGARVYITSRNQQVCDAVAAKLSELGFCVSLPRDLAEVEGGRDLARRLAQHEQKLHILVNNAGANWGASFDEYPETGFDKVIALNLKSIFFLTQTLAPMLEKAADPADPARVINIGSIDGIRVPREVETFAYSASKAGLHHMTRVLATRLGRRSITVNAVAPGPFESKMMKVTLERHREQIEATCPLGRIGEPRDMAGIAIFLASRAGAYLNGAVIPVDGGIHIN